MKVTRNFQITIPEKVRGELGVKIGDEIVVERADFGFRIHKIEKNKLEDFIGIFGKLKYKKVLIYKESGMASLMKEKRKYYEKLRSIDRE